MNRTARTLAVAVASALIGAAPALAQTVPPEGPVVSMTVTAPDGGAHQLSTHESGLATVEVKGQQYGFRPTMHDDAGRQMTITIFDMGGPGRGIHELAELDVAGGGPAVASKSTPAFQVKAWKGAMEKGAPASSQTTRR